MCDQRNSSLAFDDLVPLYSAHDFCSCNVLSDDDVRCALAVGGLFDIGEHRNPLEPRSGLDVRIAFADQNTPAEASLTSTSG
jgi:hypothetical protein